MPKTERLYYTDCDLREFEAHVLQTAPAEKGTRVYLDRTAFYPDSGGQPSDFGTLDGIPVREVVEEGEDVAHILERAPAQERVKGNIDWARRFDHMQQHTGQHVLSAAFVKAGNYKTVSFHMGSAESSIDLDSDRLGRRQMEEAEDLANQVIFEDRSVRIFFEPAGKAREMDLRAPTFREGEVRLVEVEGFDLSACGGTHVRRTGAIGLVLVRKFERIKGLTRVEFVCGRRALGTARRDFQTLTEAARLFSASLENVPGLITKQSEELRIALRAQEKLRERLAQYRAAELVQAAPEKAGRKIVRIILEAEEATEAKKLAYAVAKQPAAVALIGVKGQPTAVFFSQSPGGSTDLGKILKQTLTQLGGKGGGAKDFAQGGGIEVSKLEEGLLLAEGQL